MKSIDCLIERHRTAATVDGGVLKGTWGDAMSRIRRIAEVPTGSRAKWLVVGFWVVVLVVSFPLSKKLTGAEKNDASAYLPAKVELSQQRPGGMTAGTSAPLVGARAADQDA